MKAKPEEVKFGAKKREDEIPTYSEACSQSFRIGPEFANPFTPICNNCVL